MVSLDHVQHRHVTVNGVRLHLAATTPPEGRAAATPIVFLHGWPECWYSWRFQLAQDAGFADRFPLFAPDLRGFNDSDKPRSGYDLPNLATDVAELIRQVAGGKAHVVGHDWGGLIAWELAMRHPEQVERLAILAAPHPANTRAAILTSLEQLKKSWYVFFFQLPRLPERAIARNDYAAIRRVFAGLARHPENFTPEDLDYFVQAMARPGAATATLAYYRTAFWRGLFRRPMSRPILRPTLVLWADHDTALGRGFLRGLERYVPGVTVEVLDDCSHWIQQDQPARVNARLGQFLGAA